MIGRYSVALFSAVLALGAASAQAASVYDMSTDEGGIAQKTLTAVTLLETCGQRAAVEPTATQLDTFLASHRDALGHLGGPDLKAETKLEISMAMSHAGGQGAMCAAISQHKAEAAASVKQQWAALMQAHKVARSAGH